MPSVARSPWRPTQTHAVELPEWAAKALSRLSVPESSFRPVVTTLTQRSKAHCQPESVSNTVSVSGQIKNNPNVETPTGKEGVGNLLDQLFEYGSTTLDRLAFQKALDDIGAEASAGTAFSVQVLPSQFDRAVQLLAENEMIPALPEDAFKTVQTAAGRGSGGATGEPRFSNAAGGELGPFPQR